MARAIYEIKLKENYFPAMSAEDALELQASGDYKNIPTDEEVEVYLVVKEDDTMKLFLFTKTLMDTDKFTSNEIEVAVCALAKELGYFRNYSEVARCVIMWVERFESLTLAELEEWIIG